MTAAAANASTVWMVSVDTTSINTTSGSLDFNFNAGGTLAQYALIDITAFSNFGTLTGSPSTLGDVTGVLPSVVTAGNGGAFNDYFQTFTFGTSLSFNVVFYGPAIDTPDGVSTSGSTFAFSMYSDAAGTVPVLTSDLINGFAVLIDVNLDGTTTVTNNSSQTNVASAVPEPTTWALLAAGLAFFAARASARRRSDLGVSEVRSA